MKGIPPTLWVIALLLTGCGDSCCPDDPVDHLCYFDRIDGGVDSSVPPPIKFEQAACVTSRTFGTPDPTCTDSFEPNGDFVMAWLPATPECSLTTKSATLIAGSDVDVFRTGSCTNASTSPGFGTSLTPWAESNDDLHICIFPTCDDGSTRMLGCLATATGEVPLSSQQSLEENFATSELGFHGCCREGPGRITAVLDCPLRSTKIDTFVWLESRGGPECTSYSVAYQVE